MQDRRTRFEGIYRAYSGLILAYAARRLPTVDDAADVVAETFVVAWRRLEDVPDGEQARPWLYAVARRVLANHRRGELRRSRLRGRLESEFDGELLPRNEGSGFDHIADALNRLSDADRELLTLVAWDGLNAAQIAVVLDSSPAAVRVRLHRARRRLAQQLDGSVMKHIRQDGHESTRGATALPDPEEA